MAQAVFSHGENVQYIDHTPGSAVSEGDVIVSNDLVMIAHRAIAANALGAVAIAGGVYTVTVAGAYGKGAIVYWDDTNNKVTTNADSGTNKKFGYMAEASTADAQSKKAYHQPG